VSHAHDEVLQFKKSAAAAATENINLHGISDTSPSMVQTVVDLLKIEKYPHIH